MIEKKRHLILKKGHSAQSRIVTSSNDVLAQTVATLSHEINNPLLAITATTELLLSTAHQLPDDTLDKIRKIKEAAYRIQSVIERLSSIETINYRETAAGRMIKIDDLFPQPNDNDVESEIAIELNQ
jgi:signal transduction histidine kinase